jgi:hypothetical protein
MINLITTFYLSKYKSELDSSRTKELENTLLKNIDSVYIEKIHLFVDDYDALEKLNCITNNSNKIKIIEIGKKPKYVDFFKYINENIKDKICMISNADIYLHECDMNLLDLLNSNKQVYGLTRYEHNLTHPLIDNYGGSHDSYIFNSKYLNNIDLENEDINFYQNFPGIESHILRFFHTMNFKLLNPCYQIKIVHLHETNLRNHGPWIGLHNCGDFDFHMKTCWWVPPIMLC